MLLFNFLLYLRQVILLKRWWLQIITTGYWWLQSWQHSFIWFRCRNTRHLAAGIRRVYLFCLLKYLNISRRYNLFFNYELRLLSRWRRTSTIRCLSIDLLSLGFNNLIKQDACVIIFISINIRIMPDIFLVRVVVIWSQY